MVIAGLGLAVGGTEEVPGRAGSGPACSRLLHHRRRLEDLRGLGSHCCGHPHAEVSSCQPLRWRRRLDGAYLTLAQNIDLNPIPQGGFSGFTRLARAPRGPPRRRTLPGVIQGPPPLLRPDPLQPRRPSTPLPTTDASSTTSRLTRSNPRTSTTSPPGMTQSSATTRSQPHAPRFLKARTPRFLTAGNNTLRRGANR